jgi:NADH-quinone oxidoreductase subunit E
MLTELEKQAILEETKMYPNTEAVCIEALKIVQSHRQWVSDESVDDVAEVLGMSAEEVDCIATFYSRIYRQPVGRNVILICDGVSCMIMGYLSIYEYLSKKLGITFGQTTADNRFTLLPISCLGDCDHAPSMMINDELFNNLSIEKIDELLEKYV